MRANIPTDNDFSNTLPLEEDNSQQKVTKEQIELAKVGKSPAWDIIQKYLDARIEVYTKGLFGEDLTGLDTSIIGQRFLAAQSVIQEFRSLKDEINRNTEIVDEVHGEKKSK